MTKNSVLNTFIGETIQYSKLKEILTDLVEQSVCVELLKGITTTQLYDNFECIENKDKGILCFEDGFMQSFPTAFFISDIKEIVKGTEIYQDHFLIKLKNKVEIMLWLIP